MSEKNVDAVVQRWSDANLHARAFSTHSFWLAIPAVNARYIRKAVGTSKYSWGWMDFLLLEYLGKRAPVPRMATIGCGTGAFERDLAHAKAFVSCDAFDIAPAAIETARRDAAAAGITSIHYAVGDANTMQLRRTTYDAIWFNMSLHHVEALEHLLDQVADALTPDGFLFFNEYVGATRFAFPSAQRDAIAACNLLIPQRLRRLPDGSIREKPPIPDPADVARADPSESVRSAEIMPLVAERFDIVVANYVGGSILQFLLDGVAGNFQGNDPEAAAVLDLIFAIEDRLIDLGQIPNDFVVAAARPKR